MCLNNSLVPAFLSVKLLCLLCVGFKLRQLLLLSFVSYTNSFILSMASIAENKLV